MSSILVRTLCVVLILAAIATAIAGDLLLAVPGRTRAYKLARLRNWLATGAVYVLFYQARYAAAVVNTDAVRSRIGLDPTGFGSILISGFWTYAGATALNGSLVDRIGGRAGLLVGCGGCAAACLLCAVIIGMTEPHPRLFGAAHMVNMAFNRINVNWYNKRERGVFSGIFGVCIAVGYFVALTAGGWAYSPTASSGVFFVPAFTLLAIGVPLCWIIVRDAPSTAAHPDGEQLAEPSRVSSAADHTVDMPAESTASREAAPAGSTAATATFFQNAANILSLRSVQATLLGLIGCGWAREGFLSWFGSYLEATVSIEPGTDTSTLTTTAMSLFAIVGSLAGGFISDRYCNSRRGPVLLACNTAAGFELPMREVRESADLMFVPRGE
jgi:MFS transporter, OPA family, glycerol-3-phosphate transporter